MYFTIQILILKGEIEMEKSLVLMDNILVRGSDHLLALCLYFVGDIPITFVNKREK